jgi:predicted nucleotidyltransferase
MIKIENLPSKLKREGLSEKLRKICERNDVSLMAVSGSFARRQEKSESDSDIAIEFSDDTHKDLFDLVRVIFGIKWELVWHTIKNKIPELKNALLNVSTEQNQSKS